MKVLETDSDRVKEVKRLLIELRESGLSYNEISRHTGMGKGSLYNLLTGRGGLSEEMALRCLLHRAGESPQVYRENAVKHLRWLLDNGASTYAVQQALFGPGSAVNEYRKGKSLPSAVSAERIFQINLEDVKRQRRPERIGAPLSEREPWKKVASLNLPKHGPNWPKLTDVVLAEEWPHLVALLGEDLAVHRLSEFYRLTPDSVRVMASRAGLTHSQMEVAA